MRRVLHYLYAAYDLAIVYFFANGVYHFLWKNQAIIKRFGVVATILVLIVLDMLAVMLWNVYLRHRNTTVIQLSARRKFLITVVLITLNGLFVIAFLQAALFDYFQPFAIYDPAIYSTLYGLILLLGKVTIDSVRFHVGTVKEHHYLPHINVVLLLIVLVIWGAAQTDFAMYDGINVTHVFVQGQDNYGSYRIPSVLVIPEGSSLASGDDLISDRILLFAEARKNGSPDHGDIDMVMSYSDDLGQTWSDPSFLDLGTNKLGNFTPVFDADTGVIHMVHMRTFYDDSNPNGAYVITSEDGGLLWSDATLLFANVGVGPGHGVQLENGPHAGRLLVPGYDEGGLVYYSDDHGQTWSMSASSNQGDETAIAILDDNTILMTTRANVGMAVPHGDIDKLFATSYDGGLTWTDSVANRSVPTPLCMSGLASRDGMVYYSGPYDYQARYNLMLLVSDNGGATFTPFVRLYAGPSGYSDLGVLSDGRLVVLFENGAVEYDQRLTFMIVPH